LVAVIGQSKSAIPNKIDTTITTTKTFDFYYNDGKQIRKLG